METPRKNLFLQVKIRQSAPTEEQKQTALSLRKVGPFAPYGETRQAQALPDTSPLRDVTITSKALPKGQLRDYGKVRIKSQSSAFRSVSAVHTVVHLRADGSKDMQVVRDVVDNDACPIDPAWKQGQKKIAKASCNYMRKVYSNSKAKAESVVIVRK